MVTPWTRPSPLRDLGRAEAGVVKTWWQSALLPSTLTGSPTSSLGQLFFRLNQADLAYAAYTTKRHLLRMEKLDALHRYRVLIPFESEVLPDEYTATVAALIQYLGVPVDKGVLDPSHLWNFPERYPEDFKIAPSLVRETSFVFTYYEAASIEYVEGQVFNLRPYWSSKAAAKVIFHDGRLLQPIKVRPQVGSPRRQLYLVAAPGGHSPESLKNMLLSRRSTQPDIREAVEAVCEGLPWPEDVLRKQRPDALEDAPLHLPGRARSNRSAA